MTWEQDLRPTSFVVPGGDVTAPPVIRIFCSVVGAGSVLFISFLASPTKVAFALLVLAALIVFMLRRTSWGAVEPLPVVARRRAGEIVRAAWVLYRRRPLMYAALGWWALPVAVLAALITAVAPHLPFIGSAISVTETDNTAGRVLISATLAAALWPLGVVLCTAGVATVLGAGTDRSQSRDLGEQVGRRKAFRTAMRGIRNHARQLGVAFGRRAVLIGVLSLTVIGAPVAGWYTVRSQFIAQVVMFEDAAGRSAIRRSGQLCRHRWWHTALITVLVWSVVLGIDVLVALLLLVTATGLPIWLISAIALLCQVPLIPLGALVMTLLYGDARVPRADHFIRPA